MEQDILGDISTYVDDIADWQITRFERQAQKNSDAYPEYAQAVSLMEDEGTTLIQKLGGDEMAIEGLLCACLARGAALAVAMYKRGVLDGGRLFMLSSRGSFPGRRAQNEQSYGANPS